MAEKTYKVVKRTEYENRGKAPVYIDTSEILRDSKKTVMKLKLYNNCGKTVKSYILMQVVLIRSLIFVYSSEIFRI